EGRIRCGRRAPWPAGLEPEDHRPAAEPDPQPPRIRSCRAQAHARRTARHGRGHDHPSGERRAARVAQGSLPGPQGRPAGVRGGAGRRQRTRRLVLTRRTFLTARKIDEISSGKERSAGKNEDMPYVAGGGEFNRDTNYISTRITADGSDGYPVEPNRYRLIVARACPWANRTIIVRRLLGLEDVLSIGFCGPTHDERSWTFDLDPGQVDPVLKIHFLRDAYNKRVPDYPKGITVPAIVDVATGEVVTNDFAQITLDFSTEWAKFHRQGAPQLYPEALRGEIDEVAKRIYTEVNNGVYRCGFAGSQDAYDKAYDRLFTALDWL